MAEIFRRLDLFYDKRGNPIWESSVRPFEVYPYNDSCTLLEKLVLVFL
jgi:hypothetical protein